MIDSHNACKQSGDEQDGSKVSGQRVRHKTLSAYYSQITTLRTYLNRIIHAQRDSDPPEYLQLLDECLVCSSAAGSVENVGHQKIGESSTGLSQQEAIDRILSEVSRKDNGRNVLLFGLRANYAAGELPINTHRPAFENRHANSPSAVLRSLVWKILRTRIGDTAFRDLLVYHSLFIPVGNNCYIQLSGTPIFDLYQHQSINTDPKMRTGKRYCKEDHGQRTRKRQKKLQTVRPEADGDVSRVNRIPSGKGTADRLVLRGKMFYGQPKRDAKGRLRHGLPAHHSLNKLQPKASDLVSDTACLGLMQEIFPSMFTGSSYLNGGAWPGLTPLTNGVALRDSRHRLSPMVGMMRELLARHIELDYAGLVRRCQNRQPGRVDGMEPVTQRSAYRYIAAVFKGLFTPAILGSEHNQAVLLRHIRMFVEMRQHEVTSLHALMQDFRINDIVWLVSSSTNVRIPPSEAKRRRALAEDLVYWIINDFILPLIKNTFYVTETAATRYETVYFLHEDWEKATKPHLRQLELELLEELSPEQAYFAKQGPLGVSAVRLVPKPNQGFRPIVNLGKRLKTGSVVGISLHSPNKAMSANQVLRGVHQVLTFEKERHRDQMGCTLFGTNEVFGPIQALKQELLSKHTSMPRLYFVKMDIKSAFDTIQHDKMVQIVSDLLERNHDYCLLLYSLLLPPASKASRGSARRLFKTKAMISDGQTTTFGQHAKVIAQPMRNAVMVDMMRRKHMTREDCLKLLMTHIKENIWEVDGKLYRQKTGIPQGSKISSLLCSFFYAVLEREHLGFVNQTGSLGELMKQRLLRYIDDFLFISDDLSLARRFVQRMQAGFPEYGAFVAQGKTLLSFECATGSQVNPVCLGSDGKEYFPYCGFLIDTVTLNMSMDYARAMSTHIKQSFALRNHRRKGAAFLGWFSRQLENRNHVAYLDSQHNDARTVRLNVFLNFALTSMKIPHYFRMTGDERLSDSRASMIAESLILATEYTYVAGRARVKHASRKDQVHEHYPIGKLEFSSIALTAMVKVFTRKASQYKRIIHRLRTESMYIRGRLKGDIPNLLVGVVEEGWQAVKNTKY